MINGEVFYIQVYTDGSCDTKYRIGAWVAIILFDNEKMVLTGVENNTTNNRMELQAVIEAVSFMRKQLPFKKTIHVFSDSQYVIELPKRKEKLEAAGFLSKKGTPVQNDSMVKLFFETISQINIEFKKVKAHKKKDAHLNYNIEADLLARKLVREQIKNKYPDS